LELAQYRELAAFAQFGTSELDQATKDQLERGQRTTEILKQSQYSPMSTEKQVLIMYAAVNGYLDDIPVDQISSFEVDFHRFVEANHPEIISILAKERDISDTTEESVKATITEYKQGRV
jgi:F-type H+-transporting ATPase subunit alpha